MGKRGCELLMEDMFVCFCKTHRLIAYLSPKGRERRRICFCPPHSFRSPLPFSPAVRPTRGTRPSAGYCLAVFFALIAVWRHHIFVVASLASGVFPLTHTHTTHHNFCVCERWKPSPMRWAVPASSPATRANFLTTRCVVCVIHGRLGCLGGAHIVVS